MKRKYSLAMITLILIAEYFIYTYANVTGIRYTLFVPLTVFTFLLIRKSYKFNTLTLWFTLLAVIIIAIMDRGNLLLMANDTLMTFIGTAATIILCSVYRHFDVDDDEVENAKE